MAATAYRRSEAGTSGAVRASDAHGLTRHQPPDPPARRRTVPVQLLWVNAACALPVSLLLWRRAGAGRAARGVAAYTGAVVVELAGLAALARRTGCERSTPADGITLLRFAAGNSLCALVTAATRAPERSVQLTGWWTAVAAATATDWMDGPVARRHGTTRLGAVMDIEADSWLTVWTAAAAVRWGGLPVACLAPPVLRYADPAVKLVQGGLPAGGGPSWARATGAAQMTVLLAAFGPRPLPLSPWRELSLAVSAAQAVALLLLQRRAR